MGTLTFRCIIFFLFTILDLGFVYPSISATDDERTDLLVTAIIENDHETVATVIANGADVNARREAGWTPLHFALANGSEYQSVIMMLIEHGADVNAATDHCRLDSASYCCVLGQP